MIPNEHGAAWTGNVVPQRYIDAQNGAQALYDGEPEDSSIKEFYKYCITAKRADKMSASTVARNKAARWKANTHCNIQGQRR